MYSNSGGTQQALVAALSKVGGGYPQAPNPPWMTPRISIDGLNGSSSSIDPQLTPYGNFHTPPEQPGNPDANAGNVGAIATGNHLNPGGPMKPAYGAADIKSILQAMLGHHAQQQFSPQLPGNAHHMPWQPHHDMVNAASTLAKVLAQQHTAGLRRFQYNGRA